MSAFLEIALANLAVAMVLGLLAFATSVWAPRPALTHALWLLVFLKLVTPPLFQYPLPWPAPTLASEQAVVAPMPPRQDEQPPMPREPDVIDFHDVAAGPIAPPQDVFAPIVIPDAPLIVEDAPVEVGNAIVPVVEIAPANAWNWLDTVALAWLAGTCFWLLLAIGRLWRFQRALRFAQPAPIHVQEMARELADCLRIRSPEVQLLPACVSPMLWTLAKTPRLFVPAGLLERLSNDQLATLLTHELAHWRRRDDRVRWLEFLVLALYWWCPLVWWARRELHQAEEECCDAWVVAILPDSAKTYALALVETVDFLSAAPADLPLVASGVGRVRLLKRRLSMILQGKTPRAMSLTGMLGVAGVALLMLPMAPGWGQTQQREQGQRNQEEQQDNRGGDRKKDGKGPNSLEQIRDQIRHMQMDLEKRQEEIKRDMERRTREIHERAEDLQRLMQQLQKMEAAKGGKKGFAAGGFGGGGGGFGGGGGAGGFPGAPGGAGGGGGGGPGGFPGPGAGGPGKGPFGPGGGPIEHRLAEVERKLDTLLQEIRAMRGDMGKGPKGPGPRPGNNPNPGSTPRPPGGGSAGLPPGAPLPRGIAPLPPTAPVPPTPPAPAREEK